MKYLKLFEENSPNIAPDFGWDLEAYLKYTDFYDDPYDEPSADLVQVMKVHKLYLEKKYSEAYEMYEEADTMCRDMMDGTSGGESDWLDFISSQNEG